MDDRVTTPITIERKQQSSVAIVTCKRCGAAIVLDQKIQGFNPIERHMDWHAGGGDPEPTF